MKKSKNFIAGLLITIFISGFVSCGKDEPPVFEKGNLIGSYVGNCVVLIGSKSETVSNFPAAFKQKDAQSLYLDLGNDDFYQSIGISILTTASNFKDHGSYARFDLEKINDSFGNNKIPEISNGFINGGVKSMTLALYVDSKNPPKYTMASQTLTFAYTGIIEVTGTMGEKYSSPITYTFNLNRK